YRSEGAFSKWLAGVSVRTCAGFWRRRYRNREVPLSTLSEKQGQWLEKVLSSRAEADFAAAGRQAEARDILEWALNRLPAQERMVLELVHLEGRSVKETAQLMELSSANVKVRAFRARKKLKKLLEKKCSP
ncbi:MAG: RNA polymerase sigma factor, partial [Thermodesulfobacteriota bacterium]